MAAAIYAALLVGAYGRHQAAAYEGESAKLNAKMEVADIELQQSELQYDLEAQRLVGFEESQLRQLKLERALASTDAAFTASGLRGSSASFQRIQETDADLKNKDDRRANKRSEMNKIRGSLLDKQLELGKVAAKAGGKRGAALSRYKQRANLLNTGLRLYGEYNR